MHWYLLTIIIISSYQQMCSTEETTTNTFEVTRGFEDSFKFLEKRGLDCETLKTEDDGTKSCLCIGMDDKKTMIFERSRTKTKAKCEMSREIMDNFKHEEMFGGGGLEPFEFSIEMNKEIGLMRWNENEGWIGTYALYIAGGDRPVTERECKDPKIESVSCNNLKWASCDKVVASDFTITEKKTGSNQAHFEFQVISLQMKIKSKYQGRLVALQMLCGIEKAFMIFKFQGRRDYPIPDSPVVISTTATPITDNSTTQPQPPPKTTIQASETTTMSSAITTTSGSGNGDNNTASFPSNTVLKVTRGLLDKWSCRADEECVCNAPLTTYMINENGTRGCYGSVETIERNFKGHDIFLLDNQVVFYVSWKDDDKWRNPKSQKIFDIDGNVVTSNTCDLNSFFSTEVYNHDRWQTWSNDYFKLDPTENSSDGGTTIGIDKDYNENFGDLQGHLIRFGFKCNNKEVAYLFQKFQGEREYLPGKDLAEPSTEPLLTGSELTLVIGCTLGGVGFIGIIVTLYILLRKRRRDGNEELKNDPKFNQEDDKIVMSKADIMELAEQILQKREKTDFQGSPRYVPTHLPDLPDPRPQVGPLSLNYRPEAEDQSNGLYQEIPYEGLYLKPLADESYLDLTTIHKSEYSPSMRSNKSEYEIEDEIENQINRNDDLDAVDKRRNILNESPRTESIDSNVSAYELEDKYSPQNKTDTKNDKNNLGKRQGTLELPPQYTPGLRRSSSFYELEDVYASKSKNDVGIESNKQQSIDDIDKKDIGSDVKIQIENTELVTPN
eukprot:TCONS_00003081-protein